MTNTEIKEPLIDKNEIISKSKSLTAHKCENCKTEIITLNSVENLICPFCNHQLSSSKIDTSFKPNLVLPFSISNEDAFKIYKNHTKYSLLLPKKFRDDSEIKKFKKVFTPYFLYSFDSDAIATMSCEALSSRRNNDDKVTIKHQYSVTSSATGHFEKFPTDEIDRKEHLLMEAIEPFNYDKLIEFNDDALESSYTEKITLNNKVNIAKERAKNIMKTKLLENINDYTSKAISTYNDNFSNEKINYVLLPVWLLNIEYKNKKYTFAINGETGKIVGKLPISIPKTISLSVLSFILTQILAIIFRALIN